MTAPAHDQADPDLQEAAAWFARLNTTTVAFETLEAFKAWRKLSGKLEAYRQIEQTWRLTSQAAGHPLITAALADAQARSAVRRLGRRGPSTAIFIGAAAMLLATALTLGMMAMRLSGAIYTTGVGEQRLIRLADGSKVRLDTATKIKVRLDRGTRRIRLESGRAFFDVAHDAARPFIVDAGQASVRALGTRFDVRQDAGVTRITLVQGRVEVRGHAQAATAPVQLRAGQQITADQAVGAPQSADVGAATSWISGQIVFHAVPLRQAIAEINRYSLRPVALDPAYRGQAPVTGIFDAGDVEAFANSVGALRGLEVEHLADGTLLLSPRPAGASG
jgi:transmembrane sensor